MTPSHQTIQKIKESLINGTLEDAERVLEDFIVKFEEWKDDNGWLPEEDSEVYRSFNSNLELTLPKLYELFNQQL